MHVLAVQFVDPRLRDPLPRFDRPPRASSTFSWSSVRVRISLVFVASLYSTTLRQWTSASTI